MMALSVVGGLISAVGTIAAANAQAAAAKYNAAVNERNAQIALQQGAQEAAQQDRENRIKMAALRASFGDAGVGFAGDALTIYQDAATQAELDKQTVRYKAQLRSTGYADQAKLDRMNASSATTAGILGAFGDVIGGIKSGLQSTGSSLLQAA